jgi:hypothetical protein
MTKRFVGCGGGRQMVREAYGWGEYYVWEVRGKKGEEKSGVRLMEVLSLFCREVQD